MWHPVENGITYICTHVCASGDWSCDTCGCHVTRCMTSQHIYLISSVHHSLVIELLEDPPGGRQQMVSLPPSLPPSPPPPPPPHSLPSLPHSPYTLHEPWVKGLVVILEVNPASHTSHHILQTRQSSDHNHPPHSCM